MPLFILTYPNNCLVKINYCNVVLIIIIVISFIVVIISSIVLLLWLQLYLPMMMVSI